MGNRGTCSNCGKPIFRNGPGGGWYHKATISSACYPGRGDRAKYASPVEVPKESPAMSTVTETQAAQQQVAAWRMRHGITGRRPSQAPDAELVERDRREASAMDRQRDRDLDNAADSEQIGAWRARHAGRSPIQALDADHDAALRLNAACDSRNALWAREQARTTDAATA